MIAGSFKATAGSSKFFQETVPERPRYRRWQTSHSQAVKRHLSGRQQVHLPVPLHKKFPGVDSDTDEGPTPVDTPLRPMPLEVNVQIKTLVRPNTSGI